MMLRGSKVLVLGGWGLVGMAVCRKILARGPMKLIIQSLRQAEAEDAVKELKSEYRNVEIEAAWGDIFVRESMKSVARREVMNSSGLRQQFIDDVFERPTPERLQTFFLHRLIMEHKPDVIVDCVNSATSFAYQDVYHAYYDVRTVLASPGSRDEEEFDDRVQRLIGTISIPQLIRHIQVLVDATMKAKVHTYVKVGTTGTGGMGFNIPYTHSEDRPSGQLLSKSALAGAHSMLLFLMARTPGCPYVKEIKPAAAIAWKKIAYGEVLKGGRPIPLFDCPPDQAEQLNRVFHRVKEGTGVALGENFKSVFIDTGENGIFSTDEFFTITASQQMEFVTPEEIAQAVLWEIEGGNSGFDIIGALDAAAMGPSYRAGYLRGTALEEMLRLESEHDTISVAFEMLGPPHLSKLLYEGYLIKLAYKDPSAALKDSPSEMSGKLLEVIQRNQKLRSQIISIGVPILLPDGKRLLRGPEVKIPAYAGSNELAIDEGAIDDWADKGWVDLRPENMRTWQGRISNFFNDSRLKSPDTSSAYPWERKSRGETDDHFAARIVTHIFIDEEKGARIKS